MFGALPAQTVEAAGAVIGVAGVAGTAVSGRGSTLCGVVIRKTGDDQHTDAQQALAAAGHGELVRGIHARIPLADAATAHPELELRHSVGAVVLSVRS